MPQNATLSSAHRIAVIGGDRRMLYAARRLAEYGATVSVMGLGDPMTDRKYSTPATLDEAVSDATALLLPVPLSRDGARVNCPLSPALSITFDHLYDCLRQHPALHLFGGILPPALTAKIASLPNGSARMTDYMEDEIVLLQNAALTAEGALMLAGKEAEHALADHDALVVGYGRIGRLLSRTLCAVGMRVTVCARRRESLWWAASEGCRTCRMEDMMGVPSGTHPLRDGHPIIFNTVPTPLFDSHLLLSCKPDTLFLDLASAPFGVREEDARAAAECNRLRYIRAPGIPGVYAPADAGRILADCVANVLLTPPSTVKGTHT